MLDRKKLDDSYRESLGNEWLNLSEFEVRLINSYRRMPEKDQDYLRRIARFLIPDAGD